MTPGFADLLFHAQAADTQFAILRSKTRPNMAGQGRTSQDTARLTCSASSR